MPHPTSCAIALLLLLSSVVSAQENSTSAPQGSHAPCHQFKMRIVTPPKNVEYKLRIVRPAEGVDYKGVVINPCPVEPPQVVYTPSINTPDRRNTVFRPPSFRFHLNPEKKDQDGSSNMFKHRLPWPMQLMKQK